MVLVLRAVPTAPVTPAHRSKASMGGGAGCPLEVPRPPLGRFDDARSARTSRVYGSSSSEEPVKSDERLRGG